MLRRDLTKSLIGSAVGATGAALVASTVEAATCTPPCFAQTAAEVAAGVTPTSYVYVGSPRIDPRRYGAVGNGTNDDTAAMQTALKVAQAGNGRVMIPEDFRMLCGPLTLTISGTDALTNSFAVEGASMVGSRILSKSGLSTPLITFASTSPSTVLQPAQLVLENFSLDNLANSKVTGGHGLSLQGLGWMRISGVQAVGFDSGLQMIDSLSSIIDQQCQFDSNNTGVSISRLGSGQTTNLISLSNCRISANTSWGVNFGGGSQFVMRGCDLEQNGTSGYTTTGALQTGTDLSGTFGLARVELYENWFESNYGQCINIQALSSGLLNVAIEGGQIVSSQSGRALIIGGSTLANQVLIKNVYSPSPGDEWQINATYLTLMNTLVATLAANVTNHSYINAVTSSGLLT